MYRLRGWSVRGLLQLREFLGPLCLKKDPKSIPWPKTLHWKGNIYILCGWSVRGLSPLKEFLGLLCLKGIRCLYRSQKDRTEKIYRQCGGFVTGLLKQQQQQQQQQQNKRGGVYELLRPKKMKKTTTTKRRKKKILYYRWNISKECFKIGCDRSQYVSSFGKRNTSDRWHEAQSHRYYIMFEE